MYQPAITIVSGIVHLHMKRHHLACGLLCICVALYIIILYIHTPEPVEFTSIYIGPNIVALGLEHLKSGHQFAVFSCDSVSRDFAYSFFVPLTTLAWRRLGYGSIVLVVGELSVWTRSPLLQHILRYTLQQRGVVVFLEAVSSQHVVMMSQCSRLFVSSLLSPVADLNSSLLITSDADIWPLRSNLFKVPASFDQLTSVISVNAFCCAPFVHNGSNHRTLPMTSIVATGAVWLSLVAQKGEPPRSSGAIIAYIAREFGDRATRNVIKGGNQGWNLDQNTISLLLETWQQSMGNGSLRLVRRNSLRDRIDRSHWSSRKLEGFYDAHILLRTYTFDVWRKVQPLLRLMYGEVSTDYQWCELYRNRFVELLQ